MKLTYMCSSIIAAVCTSAGLGNPPKSFTTNNNESLNHLLTQKAGYKRNKWPSFNKLLRIFVNNNSVNVPSRYLARVSMN